MATTSGIALLVATLVFIVNNIAMMKREKIRQLQLTADLIGNNAAAALSFGMPESAKDLLESLRSRPMIHEAYLFDASGGLFAHFHRYPDIGLPAQQPQRLGHKFQDNGYVDVVRPVYEGDRRIGTIQLRASMSDVWEQSYRYILIATAVMVLSLVVAIGLSAWLQRVISTPIMKLASTARRISDGGDFSLRIQPRSEDEIGALYRQFNLMLDRIAGSERELRRLTAIIETTSDFVSTSTPDMRITYMNSAGRRLIGTTRDEEVIGIKVSQIHPEWVWQLLESEALPAALAEGAWEGETAILDHNGEEIPLSQVVMSHKSLTGEVEYFSTIARDVSEQKRTEEETRILQEQLHQSQKLDAIGQLAAGVAHDFNNILTGIIGNSELLMMALEDDNDKKALVQQIIMASTRAADLTKQLLAFSRKGRLQTIAVDIHRLNDEVVKFLGRSIDRRITIEEDLQAVPSTVMGDPSQLQNAILNMGVNARDAMPEGGRLVFQTRVVRLGHEQCRLEPEECLPGDYLELCVSDTGVGMSAELQTRIFEPFFTTKQPGEGTGLGLAGVHGTVKSHGGIIRVYSELGKGSTFKVLLPVARKQAETPEQEPRRSMQTGTGHILVVDDEQPIRVFASRALQALGYSVSTCSDGVEAVATFSELAHEIDLVILDLNMPRMDGQEAFRRLREIDPNVRVLVASGFSHSEVVEAVLREGALGFLHKPFRLHELAANVARHIPGATIISTGTNSR